MLNGEKRVISGLRPKSKKTPSTAASDASAPKPIASSGSAAAVLGPAPANALNRMCDLILPWRILDQFKAMQSGSGKATPVSHTAKELAEVADAESAVAYVPTAPSLASSPRVPNLFDSWEEYVSVWEPLLRDEIKAGVISSLPSSLQSSKAKVGYVHASPFEDSEASAAQLSFMKLHCIVNADPVKSKGTAEVRQDFMR